MEKPREIYVRRAQIGDICVLIEPICQAEINLLQERQSSLQSHFLGKPIENIHLTCQRFKPKHEHSIDILAQDLKHALVTVEPFSLTALSLQTLQVPVLQTNILKWEIQMTEDLRRFVTLVEQTLVVNGVIPLYKSGFVSTLIAALRDVPELSSDSLSNYATTPHHLFTAGKVVLSRIVGPKEFDILATIHLMRPGHNSGGSQQGFDALTERFVMFELVKQD